MNVPHRLLVKSIHGKVATESTHVRITPCRQETPREPWKTCVGGMMLIVRLVEICAMTTRTRTSEPTRAFSDPCIIASTGFGLLVPNPKSTPIDSMKM